MVAGAILARAAVRGLVGEARFRNEQPPPRVRSFRHSAQARSFRPCSLAIELRGRGRAPGSM